MRVAFLVAGVQRGGTTALWTHLAEHPALRLARVKEAHVFDDESGAVDWSRPDYGAYHALFPPASEPGPRGELTPIYLYWAPALPRIARYNPGIRLVLTFRDPVERAHSHWRAERARGWETEPFAWCVREGRARVDDPASPGQHRVFSYVERGFYGRQFERLLGLIPRAQVLCLRADALRAWPGPVLEELCAFLGVPPFPAPPAPRTANPARWPAALAPADRDHLRALYAEDLARFSALSGLRTDDWLA